MATRDQTVTTDENGCFAEEEEQLLDGFDREICVTLLSPEGLRVSGVFELNPPGEERNPPIPVTLQSGEEKCLGRLNIAFGQNIIKVQGCTDPSTPRTLLTFRIRGSV